MEQRRRTASKFFPVANPAFALDFTGEYLPPEVTFARNSISTRVNSAGLIEVIAANQPRFDFDPVTLAVKGLLVEEGRTNQVTNSTDFTVNANSLNVLLSQTASAPDGTNTATLCTTEAGSVIIYKTAVALSATNTFTIFIKNGTANNNTRDGTGFGIYNVTGAADIVYIVYNYLTNTFVASGPEAGSCVIDSTEYSDGWYRLRITQSTAVSPGDTLNLYVGCTGGASVETGATWYIWGLQLEAGAFPTSYIPTTNATVTRVADNVSVIGDDFAKWFNPWAGTFACQFTGNATAAQSCAAYGLTNVANPYAGVYVQNTTTVQTEVFDGGVVFGAQVTGLPANGERQASFTYAPNNFQSAINSNLSTKDYAGQLFTPTQLRIGSLQSTNSFPLNGTIKHLRYWQQDAVPEMVTYLSSDSYWS